MSKVFINKSSEENVTLIEFCNNSGKFATATLLFLSIISFFIPFLVFLIKEITVGKSFLLTLILFWGSSIYFTRLFLWNKYGKEIYKIKSDTITRILDHRLFKDNKKVIRYNKLEFGFCKQESPSEVFSKEDKEKLDDENYYYFVLITDNETITSNMAIKAEELIKLL